MRIRYTAHNSDPIEMHAIDLSMFGRLGLCRAVRLHLTDGTHRLFNSPAKLEVLTSSGKCAVTYLISGQSRVEKQHGRQL